MNAINFLNCIWLLAIWMSIQSIACAQSAGTESSGIDQMLDDRPELREILKLNPSIKNWLTEKFRSNSTGMPLEWDRSTDDELVTADMREVIKNNQAVVRIRVRPTNGPDMLCSLVFEVFNSEQGVEHTNLVRMPFFAGEISADQAKLRMAHEEHLACKATRDFWWEHELKLPNGVSPDGSYLAQKMWDQDDFEESMRYNITWPRVYNYRTHYNTYIEDLAKAREHAGIEITIPRDLPVSLTPRFRKVHNSPVRAVDFPDLLSVIGLEDPKDKAVRIAKRSSDIESLAEAIRLIEAANPSPNAVTEKKACELLYSYSLQRVKWLTNMLENTAMSPVARANLIKSTRADFERLRKLDFETNEWKLWYAKFLFLSDYKSDARKVVDDIIASEKNAPVVGTAWKLRGRYEADGKLRLRYFSQSLLYLPDDIEVLTSIANCLATETGVSDAIEFLQKQIDGRAFQHDLWQAHAELLISAGKLNEALAFLSGAIERDNKSPILWQLRGKVHARMGDHVSAVEDFSKSQSLDSFDADTYKLRAQSYRSLRVREIDRALVDIEQALSLRPNDKESMRTRSQLRVQKHISGQK